jgi:hypothetical protein
MGNNTKKYWYENGIQHRENGPAYTREYFRDYVYKEWWFHGNKAKDENQFYSELWRNSLLLAKIK